MKMMIIPEFATSLVEKHTIKKERGMVYLSPDSTIKV